MVARIEMPSAATSTETVYACQRQIAQTLAFPSPGYEVTGTAD